MTNIISPDFGGRSREVEPSAAAEVYEEYQPLHLYGTAAGYLVALMKNARGPEGRCLMVVIGSAGKNTIEAVAVIPPRDEGRVVAETTAMAVLRALEITGDATAPLGRT